MVSMKFPNPAHSNLAREPTSTASWSGLTAIVRANNTQGGGRGEGGGGRGGGGGREGGEGDFTAYKRIN